MAIKTQELEQIESDKKAVVSRYKERTEQTQSEIKGAATRYKDGYEMREIECVVERDYDTGEIRYIRTDNGEVATTKKMTVAERQLSLEAAAAAANQESAEDAERDAAQRKTQRIMSQETSALA